MCSGPVSPALSIPCVALQAVDALDDVRPVLEGVVLFFSVETEHLGAGSGRGGKQDQGCDGDHLPHC